MFKKIIILIAVSIAGCQSPPSDMETPLMKASYQGDIKTVKLLISNGADINLKDDFGDTAINSACDGKNVEIANLLISKGADVNQENIVGQSILMRACYNGNIDIVKLLISNGADINKSSYGHYVICYAKWGKHIHIVKYLRELGAKEH